MDTLVPLCLQTTREVEAIIMPVLPEELLSFDFAGIKFVALSPDLIRYSIRSAAADWPASSGFCLLLMSDYVVRTMRDVLNITHAPSLTMGASSKLSSRERPARVLVDRAGSRAAPPDPRAGFPPGRDSLPALGRCALSGSPPAADRPFSELLRCRWAAANARDIFDDATCASLTRPNGLIDSAAAGKWSAELIEWIEWIDRVLPKTGFEFPKRDLSRILKIWGPRPSRCLDPASPADRALAEKYSTFMGLPGAQARNAQNCRVALFP